MAVPESRRVNLVPEPSCPHEFPQPGPTSTTSPSTVLAGSPSIGRAKAVPAFPLRGVALMMIRLGTDLTAQSREPRCVFICTVLFTPICRLRYSCSKDQLGPPRLQRPPAPMLLAFGWPPWWWRKVLPPLFSSSTSLSLSVLKWCSGPRCSQGGHPLV